ncbi:MAG: TonB-dependent receptor [Prolixibacteraceae bacterium]|nr:TonB-dependent receptor [Prolixibacteraceae bacterium]
MKRFLLSGILVGISLLIFAQPSPGPGLNTPADAAPRKGSIKGKLIEEGSKVPLEYANIAVYSQTDSSLIGGGIADLNGDFIISDLKPGTYYIDTKFIGFEHTRKFDIEIGKGQLDIDLGTIILVPSSENIGEVNVYSQDKPIVYEIDKKIIDPAQFPTTANGTATDVLANTPSVVVDIEGNVTMRGSSNFTVLIDGRPTPFEAADALDQVPASTIRNIEIITNPSAKYDPDGNAGIININTKKSKMIGLTGIVNGSADTNGSLSGDFLLNFKREKINFFINGNLSDRRRNGSFESENITWASDTITTLSWGDQNRGYKGWSLKTGFDYYFNDFNTLTFNVGVNGRNRYNEGLSNFSESSSSGFSLESSTENLGEGKGEELSFGLDYRKTFEGQEGREFTAYLYYETGNGEDYSLYNQYDGTKELRRGQKNWEVGDDRQFRFKADYIHPFANKMKLEAGYQARIDRDFEWNDVHWYNTVEDYQPSPESEYYSETYFKRDIHSLYSTFSRSGEVFGFQAGLRTEYTNRVMEYSKTDEPYTINRLDWFPTLHLSFQLPLDQQLIASYSRRIDRPRGHFLEPFITYIDAYSVRKGNPAIEPEYIDSYELGYQKQIGKGFLSMELFHRKTNNRVERITSVYEGNVMMQTIDNVGVDYSTGLELMLNTNPTKWWMLNLMGNAYHYAIEGELNGVRIDVEPSFNWHTRLSNTFSITKTTKFQFDAMYHSPTVTAQGSRKGFLFTNMAVRQDLFKNKLNLTLSVRDVFDTAKFGFESSGPDFYAKRSFDMKSPVFAITLSYKINNYKKPAKGQEGMNGQNGGEGDMMDMDGGEM